MNLQSTYDVQVKHRSFVFDNIKHWKIFQDDQQIKKFLECVDDFSENQIDQDQEDCKLAENQSLENMFVGQKIMELKSNHIPKSLVPLERLFDSNDVYKKASKKIGNEDTMECNIGTNLNSKIVKISKKLAEEERFKLCIVIERVCRYICLVL